MLSVTTSLDFQTFMMSAQKRKFDATEFGSSGSKIPEIPEAMGIVPIDPESLF